MSKRLGWLFAILATISYSANTPLTRAAILVGMSPLTLLVARFSLGSLLNSVALSAVHNRPIAPGKKLDRFGLFVGAASGFINGLTLVAFFTALETVSASIASLMGLALIQIFTLLLLALRGEKLTLQNGLRLAVGLFGLYLLVGFGGSANPFGLLLITVGAAMFALHLVSVQWFLRPYSTWTVTTLIVTTGTIPVIGLWLFSGAPTFVPLPIGLVAILIQGLFTTFVGRIMTYQAINIIGSAHFALLNPLEAALTVLWASIFLGERLTQTQWIGTLFIFFSLLLASEIVWRFFSPNSKRNTSQVTVTFEMTVT